MYSSCMGEICLRCGSSNIKKRVLFGGSSSNMGTGPQYKYGLILNLQSRPERAWCDLCIDCGEITRLYVTNTDHEWWTKDEIDERRVFR